MKFLSPLPLLVSGDHDGNIVIWDIKSYNEQYKCLLQIKNMDDKRNTKVATAFDYLYNESVIFV